jgi:hypothetical protein
VQGLFAGSALPIQAQPSRRAAADEDIGKRSAVYMVAGREMIKCAGVDGFSSPRFDGALGVTEDERKV